VKAVVHMAKDVMVWIWEWPWWPEHDLIGQQRWRRTATVGGEAMPAAME
jgi:hypothetical protein